MQKRGFTLIELLVVVAIIGLLSAIVLASLSGARSKGRDGKRVADLKQLQLAIQLYYDACANYPTVLTAGSGTGCNNGLVSNSYISVLPADPSGGSAAYGYVAMDSSGATGCNNSSNTCVSYVLGAKMENDPTSLNGYVQSSPTITINGGSYNCSQTGSTNYIYCVHS